MCQPDERVTTVAGVCVGGGGADSVQPPTLELLLLPPLPLLLLGRVESHKKAGAATTQSGNEGVPLTKNCERKQEIKQEKPQHEGELQRRLDERNGREPRKPHVEGRGGTPKQSLFRGRKEGGRWIYS